MSTNSYRLQWLDSLRGIAAILVCIQHLVSLFRYKYPSYAIFQKGSILSLCTYDVLTFGRLGVVLFFFISGYVIPYSLQNRTLKHFIVSRVFRLYPAYWVSIILAIILLGCPSITILLFNITMFQKFFNIPDLVGVFWTLQIEIVFYILCGILFSYDKLFNTPFLIKVYYILLLLSLIMALTRFETNKKLPVALMLGLSIMILGFILRRFNDGDTALKRTKIIYFFTTFSICLIPITLLAYNQNYGFDEHWYNYFVPYLTATFIFLIFSYFKFQNSVMVLLGSISFSVYLLHTLVIDLFTQLDIYRNFNPLTLTCLFFLITITISTICYYAIEKPVIKLGKRLLIRIQ